MASPTENTVIILEKCRVRPASSLPEICLPLTFFDTVWLRFPHVEKILFYELTGLTPTHFNSVILPNLKRSLSLTLNHFFPLAGRLTWPPHDPKPSILYRPDQDYSVALTAAESKEPASFLRLAGTKPHKAAESHLYVPELHVTDSEAAVIAAQVTLFANHGIAVAVAAHHAILDGRSAVGFFKAWAHMNQQLESNPSLEAASLTPELTPFVDRSLVHDPESIYTKHLENWFKIRAPTSDNPRSLSLLPSPPSDPTLVRANFELSIEDVRKLREMALSKLSTNGDNTIHLSTFVLIYSYSLTCLVKSKDIDNSSRIRSMVMADCRARLDPSLPDNYFGNCVSGRAVDFDAQEIKGEGGFVVVAKNISERIKDMANKSVHQVAKENLSLWSDRKPKLVGVAGAPRLGFYQVDFGWGRPAKVEYAAIDRTGAISFAESRDGSGGVEIGLVLTKDEMDMFESLFSGGLKDSSN